MHNRTIFAVSCALVLAMAGATLGELVGHWALDEGSGTTAADSSGKGNIGTIKGSPAWIEGIQGSALEFHGTGVAGGFKDYVDCGKGASLNITGPTSITLWIRPDANNPEGKGTSGGETAPMAKADSATGTWSWQVRYGWNSPKPYMSFTFNTSPRAWAYVNRNLEQYEWCHIACSFDGATLKCYLNGEQTDSTAMGPITSSNTPVLIGSDGWGCDWQGAIDDVRIYNHALTGADIATICPPSRIAKDPSPADGAIGIEVPMLQWKAGYAGVLHNVYLGTSPELDPNDLVAPGFSGLVYWHIPGIEPGVVYYWRVDEIEADGVTVNQGEVWSFTAQALTAYAPHPADGAADVSPTPTLTWAAGQSATKHHVYFSENSDAVSQGAADADKGETEETSFAPGDLESVTTYYWRVDEVLAGGGVMAGPVWSFTTHLPIEDFETYTDNQDAGEAIFQTWIDGLTNNSGSYVGYENASNGTFGETTLVRSGAQSMPIEYNNVDTPFYSEVEREFDSAQDWTVGDVNTLVLFVRGKGNNVKAPLYIVVEDSSGHTCRVVHPDPKISVTYRWVEWQIPFDEFTAANVNMARVKKLVIGLGDTVEPKSGGRGQIYVDNIFAMKR